MRDNTISKVAVISFLLTGMIMGIILGPFFDKIGSDLLWGIVVMLAIVLAYSLIKVFVSRQRSILKKPDAPKAESEVGFVVDTFHDVVGRLKEKELELEKLKSSAEENENGSFVAARNKPYLLFDQFNAANPGSHIDVDRIVQQPPGEIDDAIR